MGVFINANIWNRWKQMKQKDESESALLLYEVAMT